MPNLIGRAANQVPTNGTLGTAAFINAEQMPISAPQQAALDAKPTRVGLATENVIGNAGATRTVTWAAAQYQAATLDQASCAFTFDWTGAPVGRYQLKLTQDATGGRAATWSTGTPGSTRWMGVVGSPTLNTAASGVSIVSLYWDGTNAWGALLRVNAL